MFVGSTGFVRRNAGWEFIRKRIPVQYFVVHVEWIWKHNTLQIMIPALAYFSSSNLKSSATDTVYWNVRWPDNRKHEWVVPDTAVRCLDNSVHKLFRAAILERFRSVNGRRPPIQRRTKLRSQIQVFTSTFRPEMNRISVFKLYDLLSQTRRKLKRLFIVSQSFRLIATNTEKLISLSHHKTEILKRSYMEETIRHGQRPWYSMFY